MKKELIEMINEVEQALLSDVGTVEISLLARKVFSQLKEKKMGSWLEKEIEGIDKKDITNLGLNYRILHNLPTGVVLNGIDGFIRYKGFRELFTREEYFVIHSISEVCEEIKSFMEDADNSDKNLKFFHDMGPLDMNTIEGIGLKDFVSFEGPIHCAVKIGISQYRLVERGFRGKLYGYIIDIQQKYKIESSPKLKLEEAKVKINNINMGNNNKTDAVQSGDGSESNKVSGVGNTLNSKSKVEQKLGLLSKIIGWFKVFF